MSLIVTGTVGIDTIETPSARAEKVLGGSCTYFAAAASFYGPVRMVAAAGGDLPGSFLETMQAFEGLDTRGLEIRPGSKTFAWGGRYLPGMNSRETLFTELGVLAEAPPPIPPFFADSCVVFLANTHPAIQRGFLSHLPKRTLVVADTMDLWIKTAREDLLALMKSIDGLVLNYDEAEQLTGLSSSVAAARKIVGMGPKFVVVKKGEHGCLLATGEGLVALPAYPSEKVVDPTGAGDSFAGGLMGFLAASDEPVSLRSLRQGLAHGGVMASFTIEDFSLKRLRALTREDLRARYEQYTSMIRL